MRGTRKPSKRGVGIVVTIIVASIPAAMVCPPMFMVLSDRPAIRLIGGTIIAAAIIWQIAHRLNQWTSPQSVKIPRIICWLILQDRRWERRRRDSRVKPPAPNPSGKSESN